MAEFDWILKGIKTLKMIEVYNKFSKEITKKVDYKVEIGRRGEGREGGGEEGEGREEERMKVSKENDQI